MWGSRTGTVSARPLALGFVLSATALALLAHPARADGDGDGDEPYTRGGFDCDDRDAALHGLDADGDGYSTCEGDCEDSNPARYPEWPATSGFVRGCVPVINYGATGAWDEKQAVQPTVVWDGSQFVMYYRGHTSATYNAFGRATSVDGKTWTTYSGNPVLSPGAAGTWDAFGLASPAAVYDPDDVAAPWKLYYHAKLQADGTRSIGLATSTDGINFTRYGTAPVVEHGVDQDYDSVSAHAAAVTLVDGVYHMYYSGKDALSVYTILHAWSVDGGYTFTKDPVPVLFADPGSPWDSYRVSHPWVAPLGDGLQALYSGSDGTSFRAIGGATADDLNAPWARDMADPYLWEGTTDYFDEGSVYTGQLLVNRIGEVMIYSGLDDAGDSGYGAIGRAVNWLPNLTVDAYSATQFGREVTITGVAYDTAPETTIVSIYDHRGRAVGWSVPDDQGEFTVTVKEWNSYKMWSVEVMDEGGQVRRREMVRFTLSP